MPIKPSTRLEAETGGQILFRNLVRIESQSLPGDPGRAFRTSVLEPGVTPETLRLWSDD